MGVQGAVSKTSETFLHNTPESANALLGCSAIVPRAGRVRQEAESASYQIACDCAKSVSHITKDPRQASELVLRIWEATAYAIGKDLDSGKTTTIEGFGTFGIGEVDSGPVETGAFQGHKDGKGFMCRLPLFLASDDFLEMHGLQSPSTQALLPRGPLGRYSCAVAARTVGLTKDAVKAALTAFIFRLGEVMARRNVFVSFVPLGTFSCQNQVITLETQPRFELPPPVTRAGIGLVTVRDFCQLSPLSRRSSMIQPLTGKLESQPQQKQTKHQGAPQTSAVFVPVPPTQPLESSSPQRRRTRNMAITEGGVKSVAGRCLYRSVPCDSVQYPPLLNEFSRTLAVPFIGGEECGSPSNRIATNYTGRAACLTSTTTGVTAWSRSKQQVSIPNMPQQDHDFSSFFQECAIIEGSALDEEIKEAGLSHSAFYECLHRYNHYINDGVASSSVAPFNQSWAKNIDSLIYDTRHGQELSPDTVKDMVAEMKDEVLKDYHHAIRSAIVDHILSDESARLRARVPFVPCKRLPWGSTSFIGIEGSCGVGGPAELRQGLLSNRKKVAAQFSNFGNKACLRLLDLWHREFQDLLLVNPPPPGSPPLHDLHGFCESQADHREAVRHRLENDWLSKAATILEEDGPALFSAPPTDSKTDGSLSNRTGSPRGNGEKDHAVSANIYEASATLLSNQVRGVIDRSIEAFVRFFHRFETEQSTLASSSTRFMHSFTQRLEEHVTGSGNEEAFLRVGLKACDGEIGFTTTLEEVEGSLLKIFREFVTCLTQLPRPDVKLGKWNGNGQPTLFDVSLDEPHMKEAEELVANTVRRNLANLEHAISVYDEFKHLLVEDLRMKILTEDQHMTKEDYRYEVARLRTTEEAVRTQCSMEIRLQMVLIDCAEINETLCAKADEAVKILLEAVLRNLLARNDQLVKSFETVVNQMVKKPTSELELVDLESHVEEFRKNGLDALLLEFTQIREWLGFLFECEDSLHLALLEERHFKAIHTSARWVHSIDNIVSEREGNLRREREALESKFKEQRNKFLEDLEGFNEQVEQFKHLGNIRQIEDYLERIQVLKNHFARAHIEADKLNGKEERLGWGPSTFEQLKRGEQALEPYDWLWTLAFNLDKATKLWLRGPLFQLEPSKVEVEVRAMAKEALRLQELFLAGGGRVWSDSQLKESNDLQRRSASKFSPDEGVKSEHKPIPAVVAEQLHAQVNVVADTHLGLLYALCNKSLQQRHWEQISSLVGFQLEPDNVFTLGRLIEMEVGKHAQELTRLSEAASKEHEIELALDSMEEDWKPLTLDVQPAWQTGTFTVGMTCVEELRTVIHGHLEKTRGMKSSEFVQAWLKRLTEWENWLESTDQILEKWIMFQSSWTYLEPIFSGRDLLRQMPAETKLFKKADKVWRSLMQTANANAGISEVMKMPDLLEQLNESCSKLEEVQKGLADYLSSKQISLPDLSLY
jgi:dynein heavy chain, axonemal